MLLSYLLSASITLGTRDSKIIQSSRGHRHPNKEYGKNVMIEYA